AVAKQSADDRQRLPARNEQRSVGVTEIMQTAILDIGLCTYLLPYVARGRQVFDTVATGRKYEVAVCSAAATAQNLKRLRVQRRAVHFALLGAHGLLRPHASDKVELLPASGQNFVLARPG